MNNYQELLKTAYLEAQKGTNISTQNSALLVDGEGNILLSATNSFPDNVKETEERQRNKSLRYKYSVHAERNVIYLAAKKGIRTEGLTMVCPWATCTDCAQSIIQAGIKKLVTHKQALDRSGHWQEDIEFAFNMLKEAGVEIIIFDGKMNVGKILRSGEYWEP
ncbi:MAG: deaminase [Candidatus Pacebacteria bacterium]|nr:deaminase [Candidatus Paceibacterota bacterium]